MNKILLTKILLVLFLVSVGAVVIQTAFFNPTPIYASGWGDAFKNDEGQIICICMPDQEDCYPCAPLKY
jgi:hypothetical protein